ncbi:MAG TPA: glutamyl-tRNA reductase [Ktedonobacterales bacterium]
MIPILVGLDHHTAPIELRERFFVGDVQLVALLRTLHGLDLDEVVVLSTCNRLEVFAVSADAEASCTTLATHLADTHDIPIDQLWPQVYCMEGSAAADHLFRVATGLESLVLGETQIMGQVAAAIEQAHHAGTSGPVLTRLFTMALHAGKRARTETGISQHTLSVSSTAALLIRRECADLSQLRIILLGAGETASLAASALYQQGATDICVISRTSAAAHQLADGMGAQALDWSQLRHALAGADVVVAATSAPHIILHRADIASLERTHPERRLILVDLGVPRNIDHRVKTVVGAQLYDLDDLQAIVENHRLLREAEVEQVERIIVHDLQQYLSWQQSRHIVPLITELRRQAEAVAQAEVEHALRRLPDLEAHERDIVSQMAQRIVNKLLHAPTVTLKSRAARGDHFDYAHATRKLFALDDQDLAPGKYPGDE